MATSDTTIETIFHLMETAGLKPPANWSEPGRMESAILVFQMVFRDMTDEDAMAAAVNFLSADKRFWPTPGELKAHAPQVSLSQVDDSDEKWGTLIQSVGRHGYMDPPGKEGGWQLDQDPATNAAMMAGLSACGGWSVLCRSDVSSNTANRASFRAAYRANKERKKLTTSREEVAELLEFSPRLMLKDS